MGKPKVTTAWHPWLSALLHVAALAAFATESHGQAASQERSWVALPFVIRLEGIAPIYGVAAGVTHAIAGRVDAYAAIAAGGADAQGGVVRDVPLGADGWALNLHGVTVQRAEFLSSFTRGFAPDEAILQEVAGSGFAATVEAVSASKVWRLTAGLAQSTVRLEGFSSESGERIPLPGAVLHDVETASLLLGLAADWTDVPRLPTRGLRLAVDALTAQGRAGQSDVLTLTFRATGYIPLGNAVTWGLHAMASDASLLRRADAYDTTAEAATALRIDCSSVADSGDRSRCEQLSGQLAAYIAANNRYGTALPLGGSTYLRGFRELRFRAAHVRVAATELRWRVSQSLGWESLQGPDSALELAPFWETGQAADAPEDLGSAARASAGLALRLIYRGLPVRLEAAKGEEQSSWFLTVGYPW